MKKHMITAALVAVMALGFLAFRLRWGQGSASRQSRYFYLPGTAAL